MTADLRTEAASLKSIDAAGLHVTVNGVEKVVPFAQFVQLSRSLPPVPLAGRFALQLADGDRIGGEPVGVKGEQLLWKNPVVGETEISMRLLAGLTKPDGAIRDETRKDDVVTMSNGDTVHGTVADFSATKITLQTDAGPAEIPLDSLSSIAFATTAAGGRDKPGFRVRLDDGSCLLGSDLTADGAAIQLTLPAKGGARPVDFAHVTGIEQVNGPISWLSSRVPSQSIYVPYLGSGQAYPARMNANYAGQPIFFKDRQYLRGIGVHSYSKLVFPLDGKSYTAFRTRYAIDPDARGGVADVTVRIKLDDKVVHERDHFRAGELSPAVVVDLDGAKSLTLEVDFGANMDAEDRLNWIEPALLKVRPAPEPLEPLPAPVLSATTAPAESVTPTPVEATTQATTTALPKVEPVPPERAR
jgi:hypothetical protein